MHDSLLAWSCIRTSTNRPGRNPGQRSEELGPGQETEALGLRRLPRSTFPTGMFPPQAPRGRAERPAPAHTGACVCGPRATRRGQDESEAVLSGIYHSDAETRQSRYRVRPQTKDARSGCRGPSRCAAAHVTSASKARPFRRLPTRVHQCQVAVTSARRAAPRVPRTWPWLLRTAAAVRGVAPESRDSASSARSVPFATKVASLRSGYNSGSFLKSSCAKSCIYFLKKLVDFYLRIVSDLQRNRNARMEGVRVLRTPPPTADVLCCSVLSSEPVNQS